MAPGLSPLGRVAGDGCGSADGFGDRDGTVTTFDQCPGD